MRWVVREADSERVRELSVALGVSPLLARLLVLRGLDDPEASHQFLNPTLGHLQDPWKMLGMEAAVARIFRAIDHREKILIYGDYDVDGALAVVVLQTGLQMIGAEVDCYIPHRMRDGYGMREEVMEQAARQGFSLLISVDTGIRAFTVVERARELGLDCIITDHHLPASANCSEAIPRAVAVLNPKQPNCPYPDKNLCGVGVAFKLVHALLEKHPAGAARLARLLPSFLKLVCIGTIADNVPLVGENRVIARVGLKELCLPVNHGLKALLESAGLDGKAVSAWDVGFRLAPRLNAAGRMASAQDVIELLTLAGKDRAQELALKLGRLNSERQNAEQQILSEIESRYQNSPEIFSGDFLVVDGEGWHRGVLGIVASRLLERFGRVAVLVIAREDGAGHGSGRSIEKFHLLDALTTCEDVFERFGGHAQAAGFRLPAGRIEELRRRLNEYATRSLAPEARVPELRIDAEVSLNDLSPEVWEELEKLAPHGYGNPQPVFCSRKVQRIGQPTVLKEKHLKMQVEQEGRVISVIGWRKASLIQVLSPGKSDFSIAFTLGRNTYCGQTTLQLELADLRPELLSELP
ncbi:MAG: single-stranded-DNA-specific exonuclease RecJ [Acidobacteria bacterium]|nr:single-stranded-DNA-specific exonuclease RecJ [Acidobacteriota bacterium]